MTPPSSDIKSLGIPRLPLDSQTFKSLNRRLIGFH